LEVDVGSTSDCRAVAYWVGPLLVLWLATSAAGHGEITQQIRELNAAIALTPEDASLHLRRGELHRIHRDFAAATVDINRAEALGADPREAAICHGRALLEAGRLEAALLPLARVIELDPENGRAWVLRGRALAELGRLAEAVHAFDRAIATLPTPDPDVFLARAVVQREAGDLSAALAGLDEGVAQLGPLVVLQEPALEIEFALGRVDAALARLDSVARQAAWPTPWLVRRAEALADAGRPVEARLLLVDARAALGKRTRRDPDLEARIDLTLSMLSEEP
jgi:tetratricopeptide (TPR) repeat protein